MYEDYSRFKGKNVVIKRTDKPAYERQGVIGMSGIVTRISGSTLGVKIDNLENNSSIYGVFWFNVNQIRIKEKEEPIMKNFDNIAIIQFPGNTKKYGFAIYDEELELIEKYCTKEVVVKSALTMNDTLAYLVEIKTREEFESDSEYKNVKITAEVIGVVDQRPYNKRVAERERLEEIAKRTAVIKRKLDEEIERRKTLEFYERMVQEYSDNTELAELVKELKNLDIEANR